MKPDTPVNAARATQISGGGDTGCPGSNAVRVSQSLAVSWTFTMDLKMVLPNICFSIESANSSRTYVLLTGAWRNSQASIFMQGKGCHLQTHIFYLLVLLEVANLLLRWLSTLTTFCHGKPLEIRFPARIRIKLLTHQTQALSAYIWEWPIVTNVKGIHRTLEPYAIFLSNNMTPTSSTS